LKVAILGAGQLGRMLALAGYPLGIMCELYDHTDETPGGQVAKITAGAFDDYRKLTALARRADVVTFDWENVPVDSLRAIMRSTPVYPQPAALEVAQDRLLEKTAFGQLGIPTAGFAAVNTRADLDAAVLKLGLPGILKTRRFGYDGKGQIRLHRTADIHRAFTALAGQPLIYERFVNFSREVSLIGVRGSTGETAFYPLTENVHEQGILATSRAPCRAGSLQTTAERYMQLVFKKYKYVGVLAIEFFVAKGRLIANEMAPRVHNSGHWTIEGAQTSQFENHLRAICGLPLGDTSVTGHAGMVNLIGRLPKKKTVLAVPGLHLHDYGKTEARPGRKLGHLTLVTTSARSRDLALGRALKLR